MKRKLVKQGNNALTVTVPFKWAQRFNLKAGDEVEILEDESKLSIFPQEAAEIEVKKTEIDTSKLGHFNKNFLNYLYRKGYDEILIKIKDANTLKEIQERISELIGYEIVNQKENSVTIKSISTELSSEFDTILRRTFLITIEFADKLLEAIENNQLERLDEIRPLEKTNTRFAEFCMRDLNKHGYKEKDKTIFVYTISREIEQIADTYKYLIDYLKENKKLTISKEVISLFKRVNNYLRNFYELFYKFDEQKAIFLNNGRYNIILDGLKLSKNKPKESLILFYLINITQQVYELAGPYYSMHL